MLFYDVVIVGGGPSGSSLAYMLQKQGISCCIIDRAVFPREKLCGGLLTEKTVSMLANIYGGIRFPYERVSSTVSLFFEGKKLSTVSTNSEFYLVKRYDFDYHLIQCYEEIGGIVYAGEVIKHIDQSTHQIELLSGKSISYRLLVGADGANSFVRKYVSPKYRANAICVESVVVSQDIEDDICVHFIDSKSGYGWCFPKNGYYSVGIGGDIRWNRDIKQTFVEFSKAIGKPVDEQAIQGALVPFGKYVKKPYGSDILLIGDAAGLVDPITGEGLYFALRSAKLASEAIRDYFKSNTALRKTYGKAVKAIHAIIKDANRFSKTYFSRAIKRRFLGMLEGKEHIIRYYCENLLSKYAISYMSFPIKYYFVRRKRIRKSEDKG